MRITLILAAAPHDALRGREPFMPLSLPLLAGAAPEHDYHLVDMLRPGKAGRVDLDRPTDLVGISMRLTAEPEAYRLADAFRARGVPVVLGGPQASAVPHRALAHADAVVVGEAEQLWPVLLQHLAAGELRQFYVCSPRPFDPLGRSLYALDELPELRGLPRPRRELMPKGYRFATVLATRGCPMDCEFCAVPGLHGHRQRLRPVEEVAAEIGEFSGFYYLLDDTVFGRPASYAYYRELYRAIARLPGKKRLFTGQANLDALDSAEGRAVVEAAVEAGLIHVAVGLESLDPEVLRASGTLAKSGARRGQDADPATRMGQHLEQLKELGLLVSGWFTVGYEADGPRTIPGIVAFCRAHDVLPVVSPVNALPGTRLYQRLEAEGRLDPAGRVTNVPHPTVDPEVWLEGLEALCAGEYTLGRALGYARRHYRLLGSLPGSLSPEERVRRTVFAYIMHRQMGRIIARENQNLRGEIRQNYLEGTDEPARLEP